MKTRGRAVFRFLLICGCVTVSLIIVGTVGIWMYLTYGIDSSIDHLTLFTNKNGIPSKLYTVSSNNELVEYGEGELSVGKDNDYASIETIPKNLINAFIAIEDKRFYSHIGFDYITTTKAVFKYIISQGSSPGGSTITQQLIKNLTGNDEISIKRKLTEIMQAVKLEKHMSKDEILELYLNSIYLSQGTYGVCAAARLYFSKSIEEITLLEAAAIAAITQAPAKWDPIENPDQNLYRRNIILKEMLKSGMIDQSEFDSAYNQELLITPCYDKVTVKTSSWYTDTVISEAITLLESTLNVSRKVAENHVFRGGYRIVIAANPKLQSYLETVYVQNDLFSKDGAQSSFVIIDPQNGNVLALVGGVGEKTASRLLNRATQTLRSPGSAIKPLSLYLPAIETGIISYGTQIDDVPLYFGGQYPASGWPKNASGMYCGLTNPEKAVASSLNTAAVAILDKLGINTSYRFLEEKLHISSLTEEDRSLSSLALGGMNQGTSLLELTAAYTTLANAGVYSFPKCVIAIYDSGGNIVVDNRSRQEIVCSEKTAQTMTKLLSGVISRSDGTAYGSVQKLLQYSEVAGKTGTTSYNYDRWFVGYTPRLIGGIWLGYDEQAPLSAINGKAHIKLWDQVMTEAHKILDSDKNKLTFADDLLIEAKYCICSGKNPTEACFLDPRKNTVQTGFFTRETLPEGNCDIHFIAPYCQEGKGIGGNGCPEDALVSVGLITVNRSFPVAVAIRDFEYTGMKLEEGYTPYIDKREPYYKYYVPQGINIGISNSITPFHRFCQQHPPTVSTDTSPPDS